MRIPSASPRKLSRCPDAEACSPIVPSRSLGCRHSQRGVAVIVMLALLSIMLLFIWGRSHCLHRLHLALQRIEHAQLQRWHVVSLANRALPQQPTIVTNSPPSSARPGL